jgi:hypothetical protein
MMARGTQLRILLADLRAEAGHSTSTNLGDATQEMMLTLLERVQRRLWSDWSWPFLQVHRDVSLAIGQRYYDLPTDVALERIERAEVKDGGYWHRLIWGISSSEYSAYDSDQDSRSWPPLRWDAYEGDQLEIWPMPSQGVDATTGNGTLRLRGVKTLSALVALDDTADLDDQLVVLFAAAELLARQKSGDAELKLAQANAHYQRLKARLSKTDPIVLSGQPPVQRERLYVAR